MSARAWFAVGLACGLTVLLGQRAPNRCDFRTMRPPSDIIKKGRIVSLALDPMHALPGTLHAHDRVDVVATLPDPVTKEPYAKVLIYNVLVWKVAEHPSQTQVELLVVPYESESLMLAQQTGKLSLALRNPEDTDSEEGEGRTTLATIHTENTRERVQRGCRGVVQVIRAPPK